VRMLFVIGDSSCQGYGRMLQEFVREENIVAT
jgi:hypothetical protein